MPKAMPDYRHERQHDRFVKNITIDKDQFCQNVLKAFDMNWDTSGIKKFIETNEFQEFRQKQSTKVIEEV